MIYLYVLIAVALLWLGALLFLRRVWFYRDPQRTPERKGEGLIIAPADGRVVYIKKIEAGTLYAEKLGEKIPLPEITGCETLEDEGWAIGIYMSPLDVHFNYCPLPGVVEHIHRVSAKLNLPMLDLWEYIRVVWLRKMVDMFARRYHLENERNTIFIDCDGIKIAIVLIADKFVAKIRCFVEPQQKVEYSQKIGFIERGSQVDLVIFSEEVEFEVGLNDQVYGGKTVIGRLVEVDEVDDIIAAG
ncbi:MAG: phosphatidylserine decarboxylase [Armatimonadetes bacterium]|nr:phosphatidylserine decarboxylase [Armatimonadota bacterium]